MAKESFVTTLGQKPLQYQISVLLGTMFVLGLLYYQFFYSTLDEDLQSSKDNHVRLEQRHGELKKREQEWTQMVKDKEALDIQLSSNQVSLPETADLASFIGHLQRQAAIAGVSFRNWSRQKEEPQNGYVKVPVSIEVVGSFHQVLKYFYLLGKTKRIITVEDFSLGPDKGSENDDVVLKADFRASTFRQADGAGGRAAAARAASSATAEKKEPAAGANGKAGQAGKPATKSGTERLKSPGAK